MPKLQDLVKATIMNRATLFGAGLFLSGITGTVLSIIKNDMTLCQYSGKATTIGLMLIGVTKLGSHTHETYLKTKEHIQEHKKLDRRFTELNAQLYCDRQGVYIAAKELGYLNDYRKCVKGMWNIIPCF